MFRCAERVERGGARVSFRRVLGVVHTAPKQNGIVDFWLTASTPAAGAKIAQHQFFAFSEFHLFFEIVSVKFEELY